MMLALHKLFGVTCHIVTQVIESELIVRSIRDIGMVGLPAFFRIRLVSVNTIHCKSVELEDRSHPFTVTARQVVVYSNDMNTPFGKGVEEGGKRGDKCFSFTCGHLSDLAFMEYDTSDKLNIIVQHIPGNFIAGSHPPVFPDCTVTFNGDMSFFRGEPAVVHIGRYLKCLVLFKTPRGILYDGKGFRQDLHEYFLKLLIPGFFEGVNA